VYNGAKAGGGKYYIIFVAINEPAGAKWLLLKKALRLQLHPATGREVVTTIQQDIIPAPV